MIDKELEARILRHHFVEQWGVNTIARQLGIHHTTVDRVLAQAGLPKAERARRPSIVDPYHPLILETLAQYPTLTAARLLAMARVRGYTGGDSQFRAHVAQLRPRRRAEAYLRLKTLPGEQAQVDWGHFGHVQIGRARRPLMAFVLVLSYSRQIVLRFYLDQRMDSFLRGHVAAFEALSGVARVLLYDNLRSAVLERRGSAIRFHPTLLDLSAHYRFEPRPVAPARGNEKGRVERAIRYIRSGFFAGRTWTDLDDLNAQADAWCRGTSAQRPCPEDPTRTVAEVFAQEQAHLIALPDNPYPTEERREVHVGKTPYVRFDGNDYSVPHTQVRRSLTVAASLTTIRVLDGATVIAQHPRSFDQGQQIENPDHIADLVATKRAAAAHRGLDRLAHAVPASQTLLQQAAARATPLTRATRELVELLDAYGAAELEQAITEALAHDVPHPNAVRQALERRREQRDQPPPLTVTLPDNDKARGIVVRPADLASYDQLHTTGTESSDDDRD
ncbi:IS21 family transposase [Ectothiorhodospira haloalkaliphila]|uniref:IS21 family transposase n=1 Tax=Ectothiorhodospira haloalkaliphila TaxID=421628 RepID=UPI001EE9A047|nr:IS21 family transposase [Ectothiorhodospira haloalkaliphila]MCG5526527.1 IS21 family transposase [Ectothiorhodospira haloalkaliphila]